MSDTQSNQPQFIIAEVGASHEGVLEIARLLIKYAADAGAHAVKFQIYDTDRLCDRRHAHPYRDKYTAYQIPHEWLPVLRDDAHAQHLELVLSVYDQQNLEVAAPFADRLKVASFEAEDYALIRACHATGKPVIVSSGLTSSQQLQALRLSCKMLGPSVSLLHCISSYPTIMSNLNLAAIRYYRLDGFSDHSGNILAGALAISHGAKILEVHIKTYTTPATNPDYFHSLSPFQFAQYCVNAQLAHMAIGEKVREILPCEQSNTAYKVRI